MSSQHRAVAAALLSALMMGGMAFSAKVSAQMGLAAPQIAFLRFAFGLLPLLFVAKTIRTSRIARRDLMFYRCASGSAAVILYFLAIEHGTVGGATLLNSTAPLFAGIFSIAFLGESVSRRLLLAMAIALTGVVMTAKAFPTGFGLWECAALLSAVASGAALTSMRAARREESIWTVYGSVTLFGMLSTAPWALAQWRTPSLRQWVAVLAMAALAFGGQILMTSSLRWLKAMTLGVVAQLAVVVSMVLGYFFLNEPLTLRIIGAALLTTGGIVLVIRYTSSEPRDDDVNAPSVAAREPDSNRMARAA
jgi:drug/metabolite transporter (DMT)-like permease